MKTLATVLMMLGLGLAACASQKGTIGAVLGQKSDGRLFVRDVEPGLAAQRGGLASGDEILLIEGRDVRSMTNREVHRVLSGDLGEPVKLTIVRGDAVLRVTLRRTPARRRNGTASTGGS